MLLGGRTTDGPPLGRRRLLGGPCHPPALARAGLPHGRERIDGILPARFHLVNSVESERNCATARPIESASFRDSS